MGFLDFLFSKKETPIRYNDPVLDTNDVGDICSALSCLIGYAVYSLPPSEEKSGMLLVNIDNDKRTTEIYANSAMNINWIKDSRNINDYNRLNVPKYIAAFLCQIPFENNGGGEGLKIVLNTVPSSSAVKKKIDESKALMPPYSDLYFNSKAYFIEGTNKFCINLDIAHE